MRTLATAALLATLIPAASSGAEDSSIRCDRGIVTVGDATIDLLGKCGAPALREPIVLETSVTTRTVDAKLRRTEVVGVERWTYDFGPSRFVMFVTLEDGKVASVHRGGYGYSGAEPPRAALRRATCEPPAIRTGDSKLDLLARCGEPAVLDIRPVVEAIRSVPPAAGAPAIAATVARSTAIEVWTYDFGPQFLVRRALLEDGVVTRVETGGHGDAP
jgi:Protein of unknown function (DUF2845)